MITIVKRPLITEKTLTLASRGWYTFEVFVDAAKPSIAEAINTAYKVNVTSVRVMNMHGKVRRVGKMSKHVKKEDWKKALVQLKKGQKIDVFEVTTQQPEPEAKIKSEKSTKGGSASGGK